ncbi:MAG TPA: hypothetical protein VI382_07380 [Candidatus Manganitrophaceae bacterium]|nr:hypothetical protein [Candidatus Manganitrophaceae bacterium]
MLIVKVIILLIGLSGFGYGFYCQIKARQHISRDKLANLKDVSVVATGPMPPKAILSEEGLKYHFGFRIGVAIFCSSIILLLILSKLYGS